MSRPELSAPGEVRTLPVSALRASPANPRKRFEGLEELAASIRAHGVLSPLLVRFVSEIPWVYEIVAGERRFRAAQLAGLTEVPVIVRDLDDREAAELAVLENIQRDALTPLEEADGFRTLVETHGMAVAAVAERVGRSRGYVANRLAIAHAGEAVRTALADGRIGASVALVLARLPEAAQAEALGRLPEHARIYEALNVVRATSRRMEEAPFDVADASLCPASGACAECPRRSGFEPSLFAVDADYCLDGECWRRKAGVAFTRRASQHNGKVLTAEEAAKVLTDWGVRYGSGYTDRSDELRRTKNPKSLAALEKLPVTLAQRASTGAAVELLPEKDVYRILSKNAERPTEKALSAPKQNAEQKAAEAERKRCEAAGAALIAAAVADRKNAAVRLIGLGRESYGDDFQPMALAVAGATKQTALAAWARKATKDDFAAFILADRLEGEYCGGAEQVRALAARLDLPVPEGFAEAPKPRAKAAKKGGAK